MPVDVSHLCDNLAQTLDSLILFLPAPGPQKISLIFLFLPTFGSNISKYLCLHASFVRVEQTQTREEKKSDTSEEIERILRVIITAVRNQSGTYFQEWWASSCGASF